MNSNSADHPLPTLTADLPGIGGRIKVQPEDFEVEEIPAYQLCGAGEHLFLWIQKTGLTTEQLTRHLVRTLRIAHRDIGVAALKDRHAVTRQYVSVPARCAERLPEVATDQIQVLQSSLHQNKLRTGHLKGNRFSILLRDVAPEALVRAQAIAARIAEQGVPNYFGDQRFGTDGETLDIGLALLKGETSPEDIHPARRRFLVRLALSATQSMLFNDLLAERLSAGELHTVLAGDVLQVTASGGVFTSVDPQIDQARCNARDVVPTGPMFGPKMKQAEGVVAERESRALTVRGLSIDDFNRFPDLTSGTRRPYVIFPGELQVAQEPDGLRFHFSLPSGAYATVVLREFQKSQRIEAPTTGDDASEEPPV